MKKKDIKKKIIEQYKKVFKKQNKESSPPKIKDSTLIIDTGIDSLGFAILVTNLEEELNYDPFTLSTEAFYPQTMGEFIKFYEKYYQR